MQIYAENQANNQTQQEAFDKLVETNKGLTGFGHDNSSANVVFASSGSEAHPGYIVVLPNGEIQDQRRVSGKSGFNKIMGYVVPPLIAIGAGVATGGVGGIAAGGLGATAGAVASAVAGATMSGASGEKIALAGIIAYAGAEAMSYLKQAIAAAGVNPATVENATADQIIKIAEDNGIDVAKAVTEATGRDPSDILQEMAEKGIDLTTPEVAETTGQTIAETISGSGAGEEATSVLGNLGTAGKVAGAAGAIGSAASAAGGGEDVGSTSLGSLGETTVDIGEGGTGIGSTVGDIVGNETPGSEGWYSKLASALGLSTETLTKLGISGATTLASLLGGGNGASVSQTSTTNTLPAYVQQDAEGIWDQYINDFYGIKDRAIADEAYKKTANDTYLTEAQSAWKPYQDQITQALADQKAGTGGYKPFTLSFGGKEATTFVPRPQRETEAMKLGTGKEGATVGAGLAQLKNDLALKTLPGAAADTYSAKLNDLMKYVTGGNKTTTGTTTVPEEDTWTKILNALGTGANIYSKLFTK